MRKATLGGTCLSEPSQRRDDCGVTGTNVIKLVTKVVGLSFGKDIIVEF
jgi:hypothetical protein